MTDYEKKLNKVKIKLDKARSEYQSVLDQCPHEKVVRKEKYYEAGYDYVSESHYWNECEVCGTRSEKVITYGSYYN